MVRGLFEKFPEMRLVKSASLDSQWANAAVADMHNTMFSHLKSFVYLLHQVAPMGNIMLVVFPAERWYNFDEVGTGHSKHKGSKLLQVFSPVV